MGVLDKAEFPEAVGSGWLEPLVADDPGFSFADGDTETDGPYDAVVGGDVFIGMGGHPKAGFIIGPLAIAAAAAA